MPPFQRCIRSNPVHVLEIGERVRPDFIDQRSGTLRAHTQSCCLAGRERVQPRQKSTQFGRQRIERRDRRIDPNAGDAGQFGVALKVTLEGGRRLAVKSKRWQWNRRLLHEHRQDADLEQQLLLDFVTFWKSKHPLIPSRTNFEGDAVVPFAEVAGADRSQIRKLLLNDGGDPTAVQLFRR